jgi:DNA-binding GntR family transcriptional regulator
MSTQVDFQTPKQLRHWVAERLRASILEGEFQPGEWLRQQRLAEDLGVSQMPIREALKELAAEGLVEHVPYRGVRVVEFSPQDVADLYAHRSFLEGMAAQAACGWITPDEIARLEQLQSEIESRQAPQELPIYRELNRRFHLLLIQASRREYLIRTLSQMWATFPTMLWSNFNRTATQPLPNRDATDIAEHRAIIAALARRDAAEAERLVRAHIETAGADLIAVLGAGR